MGKIATKPIRQTIKSVSAKVDCIDSKLIKVQDSLMVEYRNGEVKKTHISELVLATHEAVKDLKKQQERLELNTQILVDFNKIHKLFKKYRIYKVIGILNIILVLVIGSVFGIEWLKSLIKLL